ncbi:putative clathrin assembly protein At2g01600 [Physcomitrium patens]|uniref:ENTH domain-containing protein n=1 Tax=Physcomitrium patens TaxID=3218 RepID=A0A2K1JIN6_PHYPA|nr:putative clathrin assembly protein At2g01600 [Physcomitrium patens]PNR41417.1 hypothetical protein PHYPA_018820 [Physcomitrium patens]|eukprot:XP_024394943.1 putative clathrin assembly protein At2g01600 [Physcomitrella patens]
MAEWLRRRSKLVVLLGLLKDQTAAGLARASGPFSYLQIAMVMATNHSESLPLEKYVEEIIASGSGSRMQVSFCTRFLVKRLNRTRSWAVAIKCLIILHRCHLDGGFLFQDLLAYNSTKEGKGYLSFPNFKSDPSSVDWPFFFWVKRYARYLDERLCCCRALKSHLDSRWKSHSFQNTVEITDSRELLHQLDVLQSLLHELCQCKPSAEAEEHPVIQGALVLVVMDSYKVHDEIRVRLKEMLARVKNLELSECFSLLHNCKRALSQMQTLQKFLESCKELSLFLDIPFPEEDTPSELDIQTLTESIQSMSKQHTVSSYMIRSESSVHVPFRKDGLLPRSTSLFASQPRQLHRKSSYAPEDAQGVYSGDDFIDISHELKPSTVGRGHVHRATMPDLISF